MENKITSHLTKGLIIALVLVVISIIAYFTGNEQASWVRWGSVLILIGGIIWTCISYGKELNHSVTFGNVFAHGFKTSAVVTVIVIVFTIAFFLIFPEMVEKQMNLAREEMEKQPNLTDDQLDTAMNISRKFFWPIAIGSIMFLYLLIGVIASLIGAGVTKKNPPTPFANQV
jgi:hypothetical protein